MPSFRHKYISLMLLLATSRVVASPLLTTVQVHVKDATGAPRPAACSMVGNGETRNAKGGSNGVCVFQGVAEGEYRVRANVSGFTPGVVTLAVPSAPLFSIAMMVRVPEAKTNIDVVDWDVLMGAGNREEVTAQALSRYSSSQMSRDTVGLVLTRPGWVSEANGVLHPRGAEYQTQYIIDGIPQFNNRSPAFAPQIEVAELQSVSAQTGGFPASIGRKMGGVVELNRTAELSPGWHGTVSSEGGAFASWRSTGEVGWARGHTSILVNGAVAGSDRFLDPPTIENFHNGGHTSSYEGAMSHASGAGTVRITAEHGRTSFDVPNELVQQVAGQRQGRSVEETNVSVAYDRVVSDSLLAQFRASALDLTSNLRSNELSTPIIPSQDRNDKQFYVSGAVLGHRAHHDLTAGADVLITRMDEKFGYQITDAQALNNGVAPSFAFSARKSGVEPAAYVLDRLSWGPLVANVGLRWDYYDVLVRESQWSPRVAAAWDVHRLGLVVHGAYDRVFSTPAIENLLLASSAATRGVSPAALGLPVHPERGDFFEVGVAKQVFGFATLTARAYRRVMTNFADDDVFLNTGVSFPIAFSHARIEGIESSLRMPLKKRISAAISYSNLSGTAQLPVTGGLFLSGGADVLQSRETIRISQDQRNTGSGEVWYQMTNRFWMGSTGWYSSGLPVEIESGETQTADARILSRVDFARGRLKPSYAVDVAVGAKLWGEKTREIDAQVAVSNITNHLNVINFAGLFSGTALGTPRSFNLRMKYKF